MKLGFQFQKKVRLSWYIKLNLLVCTFICVVFLISQINSLSFRKGITYFFSEGQNTQRSVRILAPHKQETQKSRKK